MSNIFTQKNQKTFIKLSNAVLGKKYVISRCSLLPSVKTRLAEMGLVPNTTVTVLKKAPLGDPLEILVRGYTLCLRATEAQHFWLKEANNAQ